MCACVYVYVCECLYVFVVKLIRVFCHIKLHLIKPLYKLIHLTKSLSAQNHSPHKITHLTKPLISQNHSPHKLLTVQFKLRCSFTFNINQLVVFLEVALKTSNNSVFKNIRFGGLPSHLSDCYEFIGCMQDIKVSSRCAINCTHYQYALYCIISLGN